jgi:hypothetical protein
MSVTQYFHMIKGERVVLNNHTRIFIKYHAKLIAFISPFEIMIFLYFKSFFIQNNVIIILNL